MRARLHLAPADSSINRVRAPLWSIGQPWWAPIVSNTRTVATAALVCDEGVLQAVGERLCFGAMELARQFLRSTEVGVSDISRALCVGPARCRSLLAQGTYDGSHPSLAAEQAPLWRPCLVVG